jgi:hypothetical protein
MSGLYICYSRAGFGWPLYGAGLGLAFIYGTVEQDSAGLYMEQGYG